MAYGRKKKSVKVFNQFGVKTGPDRWRTAEEESAAASTKLPGGPIPTAFVGNDVQRCRLLESALRTMEQESWLDTEPGINLRGLLNWLSKDGQVRGQNAATDLGGALGCLTAAYRGFLGFRGIEGKRAKDLTEKFLQLVVTAFVRRQFEAIPDSDVRAMWQTTVVWQQKAIQKNSQVPMSWDELNMGLVGPGGAQPAAGQPVANSSTFMDAAKDLARDAAKNPVSTVSGAAAGAKVGSKVGVAVGGPVGGVVGGVVGGIAGGVAGAKSDAAVDAITKTDDGQQLGQLELPAGGPS